MSIFFSNIFDAKRFYLVNGKGCNEHNGHPCINDRNSIFPVYHHLHEKISIVLEANAFNRVKRNVTITYNRLSMSTNIIFLSTIKSCLRLVPEYSNLSSSDKQINFMKDNKYDN